MIEGQRSMLLKSAERVIWRQGKASRESGQPVLPKSFYKNWIPKIYNSGRGTNERNRDYRGICYNL